MSTGGPCGREATEDAVEALEMLAEPGSPLSRSGINSAVKLSTSATDIGAKRIYRCLG